MGLKTLKDLIKIQGRRCSQTSILFFINDLRAEAIKWVKEDIDQIMLWEKEARVHALFVNDKWMKRLNITEEDLK